MSGACGIRITAVEAKGDGQFDLIIAQVIPMGGWSDVGEAVDGGKRRVTIMVHSEFDDQFVLESDGGTLVLNCAISRALLAGQSSTVVGRTGTWRPHNEQRSPQGWLCCHG